MTVQRLLILFFVIAPVFACSRMEQPSTPNMLSQLKKDQTHNIFGGETLTKKHDLASSVALILVQQSEQVLHCTAFLIHPRILLTAAHCAIAESYNPEQLSIHFNVESLGEALAQYGSSKAYRVKRFFIPDQYSVTDKDFLKKAGYDFALLELDRTVDPASETSPRFFQLPDNQHALNNPTFFTAGYGYEGVRQTPTGFSAVGETRFRLAHLRWNDFALDPSLSHQRRADQTGASGTCIGDSGAPAFVIAGVQLIATGVLSAVNSDGTPCRLHSTWVNLQPWRETIKSAVKSWGYNLPVAEQAQR